MKPGSLKGLSLILVMLMILGTASLVLAAELVTAEVTGTSNDVTVAQGSSANFSINVTATGAVSCAITAANPSMARVNTQYSLDSVGNISSGMPGDPLRFFAGAIQGGNCRVTWDGAPTPYSISASLSAASTTPVGDYVVPISTSVTNPSSISGGKLDDQTKTTITVHVVAGQPPADKTAPVMSGLPANRIAEATSAEGAVVVFTLPEAVDQVDGPVAVTCSPPSGATFALGETTVTCSATDSAGNTATGSFTVTVQDTTAPVITLPGDFTQEATGPDGATVSFTASASDLVDGDVAVTCDPPSGATFPLGETTVTCSARDTHGNTASGHFTIAVVDTTPPALTLPANITQEATSPQGAVVAFSASAIDLVDGPVAVACTPASGSTFFFGETLVVCSATDAHMNTATGSFTITVPNLILKGFYQPVDMNGVYNTAKNGSTVPLKFELFAGTTELTDIAYVKSLTYIEVPAAASAPTDEIETVTTGGTSLRYDPSGGQFIFNWKTPAMPKKYLRVTLTTVDGSTLVAYFLLK